MDFTPVRRWYAQTPFRSSLEADWACTLDHLHVHWRYEPVTVTLPSGEWYVPDFWLPDLATYIEVKGDGIPRRHKPAQLAKQDPSTIVILGLAPSQARDVNGRWTPAIRWQAVGGGNILLGQCQDCSGWSWVPLKRPIACRKCKQPYRQGHLAGPGEIPFRLSDRTEWTVVR